MRVNLRMTAVGAVVGLALGIAVRVGYNFFPDSKIFQIVTLGFIFFLPFAIGFVTVFVSERGGPQPVWSWFLFPWIPIVGVEVMAGVVLWEGLICIVMFTPIACGAASLGGLAAGLIGRMVQSRKSRNTTLVCVLCLPMIVNLLEPRFLGKREVRTVESFIDIQAEPAQVWKNIERVPAIRTAELPPSWSHRVGFPNPVEATLSAEGVGGVRHATFEGGVLFIETIDVWEPERRLAFSIHAQTDQIPATTLDEHFTIGGRFFDVLRGEYALESLPGGVTRLHLTSRQRLSTDFNWYAHLWTDAVMADLQKRILRVVKNRSEMHPTRAGTSVRSRRQGV
jgi:hypothetical protein